jgi:glutamate synthase domain-containing protein 1
MCGIVGLFLTDPALEPNLGRLTAGMLAVMTDRGPDSAGFALCGDIVDDTTKLTLHAPPLDRFQCDRCSGRRGARRVNAPGRAR